MWRFALLFAVGCASADTASEKHLQALTDELNKVQADHDRIDERLSALEIKATDSPNQPATPTPTLRVVKVAPDGSEQAQGSMETASALDGDDPNDTSPRPVIKVTRPLGKKGKENIVQTLPDEPLNGGAAGPPIKTTTTTTPSALDPQAKQAYESALALVNQKQYQKAREAFSAFLVRWPDHPYVENATYWRGECYYAEGEYARAAEQFEGTVARFPLGNKAPDALLKLGMSQQRLGNATKAKAAFDKLKNDYPKSDAVHRIPSDVPDAKKGPTP